MSLLYCQTPVSLFRLGIGVVYLLSQKQEKQPHRNLPEVWRVFTGFCPKTHKLNTTICVCNICAANNCVTSRNNGQSFFLYDHPGQQQHDHNLLSSDSLVV